jgi:hypothetical protein
MKTNIQVQPTVNIESYPIDLKDLVKPLELVEIAQAKRKFLSFVGGFSSCTVAGSYVSTSYDYNKQTILSYALTENFAKMFVVHLDKDKGFEYVQMLEAKANQVISLEKQLLEAQVKQLKSLPPVMLPMSSKVNRISIHQQRVELFNQGFCEMAYDLVKHYKFAVTTKGYANGYKQNKKGDIKL